MIYCEKEPYYTNSNRYFRDTIKHGEISYWEWMLHNYKTTLLNKMGSYSDPEQHWGFNTEEARTFFILRWS